MLRPVLRPASTHHATGYAYKRTSVPGVGGRFARVGADDTSGADAIKVATTPNSSGGETTTTTTEGFGNMGGFLIAAAIGLFLGMVLKK